MTGIALQDGVRPNQREAVKVLARLLYRDLPTSYRVALFAIRCKLALVNIGVAIRALGPNIREDRAGMALHARDLLVHTEQWKLRLVVVKFGLAANRLPTRERVAVVAGHVQRPVRTARFLGTLLLACIRRPWSRRHQRKYPRHNYRHEVASTRPLN